MRERPKKSAAFLRERVLDIQHYTDKLFSFTTTRSPTFRFESGQFAMIGLEVDGKPLLRAYSMASANWDDKLEFFSIKVPDGPLTSRLQHIKTGDEVLIGAKPTGTLLLDNLTPAKRLILLATGTGFAPFASILRDPEAWERFETVVVAYGCRQVAELEYATQLVVRVRDDELLGEMIGDKLRYYATVTREPYHHQGRVTDLLRTGKLMADLQLPPLNAATDRVMICGNPQMTLELRRMLPSFGLTEANSSTPAEFVIERAFVDS
ncbi:MAG: ferredoxin--NADP reductase [Hyphomicrobiaceae bacterium]